MPWRMYCFSVHFLSFFIFAPQEAARNVICTHHPKWTGYSCVYKQYMKHRELLSKQIIPSKLIVLAVGSVILKAATFQFLVSFVL